jgi:hypothetical protein
VRNVCLPSSAHTYLENLDVAAVEASLGDEAAFATRPHGQVDVGLVGTGLHRKPRERRVSGGAAACVLHSSAEVHFLAIHVLRIEEATVARQPMLIGSTRLFFVESSGKFDLKLVEAPKR